jgi:NAD-dependent deacetylase
MVGQWLYTGAMDQALQALLDRARGSEGWLVALTGAGISAESGIPTFRGEEGYWTVGSAVYRPEEMATHEAFSRMPEDVWQWYLYRRTVCRRAEPNPAHCALVALEEHAGDRFRLITQNVDGLHLRAGSSLERTYQIHGNIDYMRCAEECTAEMWPIPEEVGEIERGDRLEAERFDLLRCRRCGSRARPHVLWFDESYDEPRYRWQSSIEAATRAALILIVGTSARTNLPWQVVSIGAKAGAVIIDINTADNPFAEIAQRLDTGHAARDSAAELVPIIADYLRTA